VASQCRIQYNAPRLWLGQIGFAMLVRLDGSPSFPATDD
jgi:hypothetical protein